MSKEIDLLKPNTKKALDKAKERMKDKNKDFVLLVTGEEGSGKSSLAMAMAHYWDDDFIVERQMCMDYEDFIRTADELDNYQSIVFDEGVDALLSRNHAKKKNKIMLEWFREVRAKNLFIVVCMPSWLEVDKPIRDDRAHALVRVTHQGWCHFFNESKMKQIEVDSRGNRTTVDFPDPVFRDAWKDPSKTELWNQYESMKEENVSNLAGKYLDDKEEKSLEDEKRKMKCKLAKTWVEVEGKTQKFAADRLGINPSAISKWKERGIWDEVDPYMAES